MQTYIWNDDATGAFLAYRAIEAADRGVKVRLLVDDMDARGKNYKFAALAAHPNIEVRMFNPFGSRTGALQFAFEALGSFSRINRRMHNKSLADALDVELSFRCRRSCQSVRRWRRAGGVTGPGHDRAHARGREAAHLHHLAVLRTRKTGQHLFVSQSAQARRCECSPIRSQPTTWRWCTAGTRNRDRHCSRAECRSGS
ncbi:MAG: hypothetical protein IPF50_12315 [Proteobacteria bacterium]|nr:hypothetical protein [Pseudomonadota bacterium]